MNVQIGIVGLGKMGSAIASRLMACNCRVNVWNRTKHKATTLIASGARWMQTPRELSAASDIVISSLTDQQALEQVYHGPSGLLADHLDGKLLIDMSTVRPAFQIELGQSVHTQAGRYVECPVGGTVGPAREGKLLGLIGGSHENVDAARPVLELLCRRIVHVGDLGSAAAVKLAINLPLILSWQALGEAISLTQRYAIEPNVLVDVLADSSGASTALRNRHAALTSALGGARDAGAYDIATMVKDLHLMALEAKESGRSIPLTQSAMACFERSLQAGQGSLDGIAHPALWLDQFPVKA